MCARKLPSACLGGMATMEKGQASGATAHVAPPFSIYPLQNHMAANNVARGEMMGHNKMHNCRITCLQVFTCNTA